LATNLPVARTLTAMAASSSGIGSGSTILVPPSSSAGATSRTDTRRETGELDVVGDPKFTRFEPDTRAQRERVLRVLTPP
jgi:hypothetical protein